MLSNPQETTDLVTFTEILNGKLHFLSSECTRLVSADSLNFHNFSDNYNFECYVEV